MEDLFIFSEHRKRTCCAILRHSPKLLMSRHIHANHCQRYIVTYLRSAWSISASTNVCGVCSTSLSQHTWQLVVSIILKFQLKQELISVLELFFLNSCNVKIYFFLSSSYFQYPNNSHFIQMLPWCFSLWRMTISLISCNKQFTKHTCPAFWMDTTNKLQSLMQT